MSFPPRPIINVQVFPRREPPNFMFVHQQENPPNSVIMLSDPEEKLTKEKLKPQFLISTSTKLSINLERTVSKEQCRERGKKCNKKKRLKPNFHMPPPLYDLSHRSIIQTPPINTLVAKASAR